MIFLALALALATVTLVLLWAASLVAAAVDSANGEPLEPWEEFRKRMPPEDPAPDA